MTDDGHVRLREHLGGKSPRVTRQSFCGFAFFQHAMPIAPSLMTRWRKRVGPEVLEEAQKATVVIALETGTFAVKSRAMSTWQRAFDRPCQERRQAWQKLPPWHSRRQDQRPPRRSRPHPQARPQSPGASSCSE